MARMSSLSAESMSEEADQGIVKNQTLEQVNELKIWWQKCPPRMQDQGLDWRRRHRQRKLTIAETLEEEGISSLKACMLGCAIYLYHILDPISPQSHSTEVEQVIAEICEIAKETPEGYGLEMGLYFSLFMAGIAIFNNLEIEELLRRKLKADMRVSIYVSFATTPAYEYA